ncbi:hypothetical protein AJ80_02006 [Polytolypa hystricis UAMH7299]|uniref:Fumarate reductase n=1 Tax=Polytolypa hystricis (strain UAMH7299) TaxID=1447883 RepID=A0A2B7YIN3_POLH7|nr:hypothetical protein AJ80_02006 [Polytolypa hystricis UAMH7299]
MAFTSPSTSTSCPAAPTPPPPLSAQSVIIVGSGLAGLAAASQLVAHKVPVHMLDRAPKPGGNSIKASSGINGVPTRFQPLKDDTPGLFFNDTINSAGGVLLLRSSSDQVLLREQLIRTLTSSAGSAVNWLVDENGIDLSRVVQLGGHSRPRTHRGAGEKPPGVAIVSTLLGLLEKNPLFKLQTDATVTKVLREDEEVLGVEYTCEGDSSTTATKTEEKLHGPVIFASGGFAGDAHGLLAKYRPDLAGVPTTNQAREGSQPLLTDIGAGLLDMESVQVHPTGFIDPKDPAAQVKFLAAEALRGEGAIMLLENGTRFVNELETRKNVTDAIMRSAATTTPENTRQWPVNLVLDEGAAEAASSHLGFYTWKGLVRKTTVSELGTSALQTIQDYADIVSGRKTDEYHRTSFGSWTLTDVRPDSVMYVGQVTPVVHFTMGGVTINERSEVLDMDMKQIRGLWAAGEVAGGVHGQNRLGGSSLLECVVFGRIAGDQAAKFYQEHYATRLDDL